MRTETLIKDSIRLPNFTATGTLGTAANTVDICSSFIITQTTPNVDITIPLPTNLIDGYIVSIISDSTSTATFSINNKSTYLLPAESKTFVLSGNKWIAESVYWQGLVNQGSGVYRNYPNVVSITSTTTLTGAYIIHTPILRNSNTMFRIRVHGFAYGITKSIDFTISGYMYAGSTGSVDGVAGAIYNAVLQDDGNDGLTKYVGVDANGKLAIALGTETLSSYFFRFSVDCEVGGQPDLSQGWSIDNNTVVGFGWKDIRVVAIPTVYDYSLKAVPALSGGGIIRASKIGTTAYLNWSFRFISISAGTSSLNAASGYFDIYMPPVGTVITGVNGAANATVTATGVPLTTWQSLYYILPLGQASTSLPANFRIVSYGSGQDLPANWILIGGVNSDYANNLTIKLGNGKTIYTDSYTATNVPQTSLGSLSYTSTDYAENSFLKYKATFNNSPSCDINNVYFNKNRAFVGYWFLDGANNLSGGNGYFALSYGTAPLSTGSIVYGHGGLPNVTLDALGTVPLASWESLYYVPNTLGSAWNSGVIVRVPHNAAMTIHTHWLFICIRNGDTNKEVKWFDGSVTHPVGEWTNLTLDATNWVAVGGGNPTAQVRVRTQNEGTRRILEFQGVIRKITNGTTNNTLIGSFPAGTPILVNGVNWRTCVSNGNNLSTSYIQGTGGTIYSSGHQANTLANNYIDLSSVNYMEVR